MDPNIMEGALTPQDIFNLKVDTQARWDKISSMKDNFDVPAPNFPDYDFDRSPLDTSSQMSIYDGLFSDNPLIKQNAKAAIAQSVADTPEMKHNVGFQIDTPYDQAKKYVGKEYGFDPTRDNEDFYYRNTYLNKTLAGRSIENIGEGVGRFVGGVITKLGQTVGHLGTMVGSGIEEIFDSKGNNWLQDVAENSFTKWFENAEETIKDQWMPVFKPAGWDEMGFFEKMKHGTFWSDEVSDGAAFMGAMIAETFLMGGLGRVAGLSGLAAKTITGSSNLAKLARGAMKFTTGADDLGGVGTWALTVTGESMFEASSVFKHNKQKLIEDREAGKNSFSDEKINEIAGEKAASAFKGNLAVLGISNAFENRFIFQPLMRRMRGRGVNFDETPNRLGSAIKVGDKTDTMDDFAKASLGRPEYTGKVDRYLNIRKKLKDPQGALNFYGSRALRAVAMEGYWEENAQLAIERLSNDGKLNAKNFVKQHFDQIVDARKGKDNEASTSIGLGAIIGIAGGAGTSIVTRERRKLKEATLKALTKYENVRKQYLSFQNIYERDEATGEIKKDSKGQPIINKDKAKAVIAGLDEHLSKLVTAKALANPFLRNMLKEQLLSKFVFAAKAAGIHESVAARFNSLGNLTKDQIAKLGFDPSTPENIPAFQETFAEQSKIYDEVFLAKQTVNKPKHIKENEWEEKDWSRKTELYGTLTTIRATQKALRDYSILGAERDAATNKGIKSPFAAYNSILVQLGKLEQFAKSLPADTTFYDEFIQKRKKELMQEGEQYRNQIADMQKKGGTGELFGFNVDYEKYSKYFDEEGNLKEGKEQELIEEFVFEREDIVAHGSLTNSIAQNQYLAFKLKDKKDGYKNYEEYMKYKASIEEVDDEVDEEDNPEEEKQDIKTEQEELEAKVKEEEEKKKAEEAAKKAEEEAKKSEEEKEEEWRLANPLEAMLKDIKEALTAFADVAESLSPEDKQALKDSLDKDNFFELVDEILYGTEFTDEEIAALNEIQQMYIDYSEALAAKLMKEEAEKKADINLITTPSANIAEELNKLGTFQEKLEWLKEKGLLQPITVDGKEHNAIDYNGRVIVLMKVGKYNIPLYISTGQAGKKNVQAGKWYTIFGIGAEGWINKGTADQINDQYGFAIFKKFAKILNEGVGTIESREDNGNGKLKEGIGFLDDANIAEFNAQMNLPITPAKNNKQSDVFYSNVNTVINLVNEELKTLGGKKVNVTPQGPPAPKGPLSPEQQVAEWIDAGIITGGMKTMAESNPMKFLEFVSQQAQNRTENWEPISGPSVAQSIREQLTDTVVDYAIRLFPVPATKVAQLDAETLNEHLSEFKLVSSSTVSDSFTIIKDGEKIGLVLLEVGRDGKTRISYMEVFEKFRRKGIAERFYKELNKSLVANNKGVLHSDKVWLDDETKREKRKWFLDGKQMTEDEISALQKDIDKLLSLDEQGRLTSEEEKRSEILPAQELWEKLVKQGVAEKLSDGTYRFKVTTVPKEPPAPKEPESVNKTTLTPDALAALEEAYQLQNQAMEQMMSYEDLLRSMSIYLNENKIDEAVDEGKMKGVVVVPTMKPNEIKPDGTLTVAEKLYLQARFAFLQRLADSGNTEDFKLVLYVDEKSGTVKAKVADANNKVLKFDTTGAQSDKGVEVIFDLDLISYDNNSLPKERVEASGQKQDPMKKAMKNFQLHDSFISPSGNPYLNVDRQIVEFIKKSPNVVTASINFVTQGQLVRPGITNNPNSKTDLSGKRETLAELKKAGKVYNDDNGVVAKDNIVQNNTFIKSGRLNVRLKRNVADAKDGFEIVEFIPTTIANAVDHNGKPLADTLKPILEAAIKGELSSEYAVFLRNILNPREFLILNLGNVVLVTNTKKFVKMVSDINAAKSADLLAEKILNLTTIDDLLNTELNIDASLYQDTDNFKQAAQSYPDNVADIIENYRNIVANNVTSSAQQVKIGDGKEGVARVNKRLIVSLDINFEDMKNSKITTDQEAASNPEGVEIQVDKLDKNTIVDILTSEQPLMEDGKEITVDDALNKLNDCL